MHRRKKKENKNKIKNNILEFIPQATLDYHEFGLLTSFDIEKLLNEFIEDSYILKYIKLLVITGKGKVVKPLVNRLLKMNKYVKSFKIAGYFNGQEGAFEVILID